jgi:hypothetical protein
VHVLGRAQVTVGGGERRHRATNVTAPTVCTWTAVSNNTSWLSVTAGATGNGNGTVNFSAAANPNGTTRAGTLTIAGQTFTVNQGRRAVHGRSHAVVAIGDRRGRDDRKH